MQYVLVSYAFLTSSTYCYNWYICFIFKFLLPVVKFEKLFLLCITEFSALLSNERPVPRKAGCTC